ncbi:MAG: hypothetical protein J5723_09560 [Ruminococcus sp.]|nr:hypothetical protein [Ruminococcus sp.]
MKKTILFITAMITLFSTTSCSGISFGKKDNEDTKIQYVKKLFSQGDLNEINIEIEEAEWKDLLENVSDKKYSTLFCLFERFLRRVRSKQSTV